VIKPLVPGAMLDRHEYNQPTGRFVIGGRWATQDCGTQDYRGHVWRYSRHGGGAFSGKILRRWIARRATGALHAKNWCRGTRTKAEVRWLTRSAWRSQCPDGGSSAGCDDEEKSRSWLREFQLRRRELSRRSICGAGVQATAAYGHFAGAGRGLRGKDGSRDALRRRQVWAIGGSGVCARG